jgi:DNA-binding transcriptional regulator LsrR (DeoR family)
MPTPVVAETVEERRLLQTQRSFATLRALAAEAAASFLGLSQVGWGAPLHRDGFITDSEVRGLLDAGAVGEIAGWAFDAGGRLLDNATNDRVAGIPLARPARPRTVAVAGGPEKVAAILAAMRGRLISGLITDETTAEALLALA